MENHVAVIIDKRNQSAMLYGTGNFTWFIDFEWLINWSPNMLQEMEERVNDFVETYGFSTFGHTENKLARQQMDNENEVGFVSNFRNPQGPAICKRCMDIILFEKRIQAINDAKAFFKAVEKDDNLNITVSVPLNCSNVSDRYVRSAHTNISIVDNRTHINATVFQNQTSLVQKLNTIDFSHWNECNYVLNKETGYFGMGMDKFADNWENVIKPLVLEEIERYNNLNREDDLEL